ncbi:MAG: TolB-like 6-bladed beta-propeller domain-containing protein, partial [Parabacteroides sp.]|nr:TolB-like 6-bladed beta-propeller domain-containing protein [Parabacteroides sp.]
YTTYSMHTLLKTVMAGAIGILSACSGENTEVYPRYKNFNVEVPLQAETMPLDTMPFRYPFRIAVKDSVAVILDLHNADYFFHAFTYPQFKHLVSFGGYGEAEGQLLSPETLRFVSNDSIWTVDSRKMEITRWRIDPAAHTATEAEKFPVPSQAVHALDMALYHENEFLVTDYSGNASFYKTDKQGSVTEVFGNIPTEKHPTRPGRDVLAQVWRDFIDYNPRNGVAALGTQLGEVLEVYRPDCGLRTVLYGPGGEPAYFIHDGYAYPDGLMGFSDIHVGDSCIYAVFHGTTFKGKQEAYKKGEIPPDGGQFIYVFDLQGNPLRKYVLDRFIYGIAVDEKARTFTAVEVNSDTPVVRFAF